MEAHSVEESLKYVGHQIDEASDFKKPQKARDALQLADKLESLLSAAQKAELNYFRANAWSVLRSARHRQGGVWEWDQVELLNEVYFLRLAVRGEGFSELASLRRAQILVNTGNALNHLGRTIEAFEYWKRALKTVPNFGMALINMGIGYREYAKMLYDTGHQAVGLKHAYDLFTATTLQGVIWDGLENSAIRTEAGRYASEIFEHVDVEACDLDSLDDYSLGNSEVETEYRGWILDNGLFLSPLNDMAKYSAAAHDPFHLPNMVRPVNEPPKVIGLFNQLKQEYVSARHILWEGIKGREDHLEHYSDSDVLLYDTLDFPVYSISMEKVKIAFRAAYSLFDKIAFFINEYWELGVPVAKVNFHTIWFDYSKKTKKTTLKVAFGERENLPLRGLYWLSKDFIEKTTGNQKIALGEVMEPEAEGLRSVRNHLEHKYLKVYEGILGEGSTRSDSLYLDEGLAFRISATQLTDKSIRLMRLARAAMLYLSLAVHREESLRAEADDGLIVPMDLYRY